MYMFNEELVDSAIRYYTIQHCGEYDEEFFCETWYRCYGDHALEACITMDYIDAICQSVYEELSSSLPQPGDKYKPPLDGGYPMGC